jgi:hypothetical protein
MYEVSDYSMCLRLTETAAVAAWDTESLRYATLCMTAGSAYYELNQLSECRKKWEIFMQIQEANLPRGHLEVRTRQLLGHLDHHIINSSLTEGDYSFPIRTTIWEISNPPILLRQII